MVLAAYLAGLISTPAAFLGAYAGHWWWARYRRAQAQAESQVITGATVHLATPPPPPPQDEAVMMQRVRHGVSVPGRRRALRGHGPRRDG